VIGTLVRISQISLSRDRVALAMVFVLPILFFSIFASVFGRQSMSGTSRVQVIVADEDHSDMSRYLIEALKADPGLRVRDSMRTLPGEARSPLVPLERPRAEAVVRAGDVPIALVIPHGWGATFPNLNGLGMKVEVLSDPSDPIARHMVIGMLQRAGATVLRGGSGAAGGGGAADGDPNAGNLVATVVTDVVGDKSEGGKMISFYAAGIAVMFILFSCAGGGGSLLDEQDSGTLERVLNTNVGMNGLLAGKWLHLTIMGIVQVTVMFLWGSLVFGLDLMNHLPGFFVMTTATAAAAASFGLVLATMSRTRQQLMGFANIIILTMSALGGSMFPRFLMSPTMQKIGLVTFNAWALDGYIKVFWREAPLTALVPQLAVLAGLTLVFLAAARSMARRWESA
jgi:ABC-2 type transport system permease protein